LSAVERIRRRVIVSGRVQGVGFRWHTQHEATRIGVSGWVRNLPDGTVGVEVEGDEVAVGHLIDWLHEGSAWAEVAGVEVTAVDPVGDEGFELRR